ITAETRVRHSMPTSMKNSRVRRALPRLFARVLLCGLLPTLVLGACGERGATTENIVGLAPRASVGGALPNVVISQVYGGGGNAGATLKSDFIELYNAGP